jgi:hypothetical protein
MPDTEWRELCEQASRETDPDKLIKIIERLNEVLEQRERLLRQRLTPRRDPTGE